MLCVCWSNVRLPEPSHKGRRYDINNVYNLVTVPKNRQHPPRPPPWQSTHLDILKHFASWRLLHENRWTIDISLSQCKSLRLAAGLRSRQAEFISTAVTLVRIQ
jgi:hypothetical protein